MTRILPGFQVLITDHPNEGTRLRSSLALKIDVGCLLSVRGQEEFCFRRMKDGCYMHGCVADGRPDWVS